MVLKTSQSNLTAKLKAGIVIIGVFYICVLFEERYFQIFSSSVDDSVRSNYTYRSQTNQNEEDSVSSQRYTKHHLKTLYTALQEPFTICDDKTFLYITVISTPHEFDHRIVYRETVLSPLRERDMQHVRYAFLLGKSNDSLVDEKVKEEANKYGDILQGNFTDSYEILTIKSLFAINWTASKCHQAKYFQKIDSDVFADIRSIAHYLRQNNTESYSILGHISRNSTAIYSVDNKWHVDSYYRRSTLPDYAIGLSYVIDLHLLKPLFEASQQSWLFRLEDVYITGILPKKLKTPVNYIDLPGFYKYYTLPELLKGDILSVLCYHGLDTDDLAAIWKLFVIENLNTSKLRRIYSESCQVYFWLAVSSCCSSFLLMILIIILRSMY